MYNKIIIYYNVVSRIELLIIYTLGVLKFCNNIIIIMLCI